MIDLQPMDYVRAAIAQARAMGMNINDIAHCARHAADPEVFDRAVNELAQMTPGQIRSERGAK